MAGSSKIYEVKCPSCGAPLSMTGARTTCDYCGAVLERERPVAPEPTVFPKTQEAQVIVIQTGRATTSVSRKSGGASCLSTLFILLLLGIGGAVGWFRFREQLSSLSGLTDLAQLANLSQLEKITNTITVSSLTDVMLLPSGNDVEPDFLTYVYKTDAETYALTYVNTLSSTIRWESLALKEWYSARVLQSPEVLYTSDETKLLALNRTDGKVLWQTSLADKLSPSCSNCFELLAGRLVALVQGGTVQGFNAETGQLVWNKRLNFEPTGRLLPAGDQLLIFDRTADSRNNLITVVDPVSGNTTAEMTLSACDGRLFDLSHPLLYNDKQGELYMISGNIIGPACVQVVDVPGQQVSHELVFEGVALPSDFSDFVSEQSRALLTDEALYFSAHQQQDSGSGPGLIVKVNLADKSWQTLPASPDYELVPLAVTDNLLVVRATRSRGTERSELWGLDPASGGPRWQYVLQTSRWFKEPGSGAGWDWHLTPAGLAVLQLTSDPDQLLVELLNPQTGVSAGQKTIPLEDDYLTDIVWTDNAVWLALRKIYKVDLQTGMVSYTWP